MRSALLLGTTILLLSGCADTRAPAATGATRSDSAGIELVSSEWSPDGPLWRHPAPAPLTVVGDNEQDARTILSDVRGGVILDDGTIVIADGQSSELRVHDAGGALVRTIGRTGEGPGEFRRIGALWRVGDTLAVYDARLRRVSLLDVDGTLLRSVTPALVPGGDGAPVHAVLGMLADGAFLARYSRPVGQQAKPGLLASDDIIFRYSPKGDSARTLATLPGQELHLTPSDRGGLLIAVAAFGRNTFVEARGRHYWVGQTGTPEVRQHRDDGALERIIRWRAPTRTIEPAMIERFASEGVGTSTGEQRERMMRARREMVTHTTVPAFSAMLVDDEERLWVRRYAAGDSTDGWWDVFAPDGARLGVVPMPHDWRLLGSNERHVLVLTRDAMDRERVELRALIAP